MELKRHLRMLLTSFEKLLSFIRQSLEVDSAMAQLRGGVIIPEIVLYCTLRYIAGGSYTDIFFVGISKPSFYQVVWKTMYAIVRCENLQIIWPNTKELAVQSAVGFSSISTNCAMTECVAVLDGYHMEIATPQKKKCTMSSHTVLVITRRMASTYKLRVTTTVVSCLLGWVGLV